MSQNRNIWLHYGTNGHKTFACFLNVIISHHYFKLVFKSAMAPEGLFMLNSVTEIFKIVEPLYGEPDFDLKMYYNVAELKEAIKDRKCPVINAFNNDKQAWVLSRT